MESVPIVSFQLKFVLNDMKLPLEAINELELELEIYQTNEIYQLSILCLFHHVKVTKIALSTFILGTPPPPTTVVTLWGS